METRGNTSWDTPSNDGKQEGVKCESNGNKTFGKTDTPSNEETQEGVEFESRGDETFAKANTPSNTKADTLRKH